MRNGKKSDCAAQLPLPLNRLLVYFSADSAHSRGKGRQWQPALSLGSCGGGTGAEPCRAGRRAQEAPAPAAPAPVIPQVQSGDAGLDAFYFYDRSGAPVWLRDEAGRQAAAKVAEILDRAPIDGLAEGPALAASVRAAIAGGTLGDDAAISLAWLKYVRALKAPVTGVHYGDPALMLVPPTAKQALSDLLAAPSMLAGSTRSRRSIRYIRRFASKPRPPANRPIRGCAQRSTGCACFPRPGARSWSTSPAPSCGCSKTASRWTA